MRISRNSWHYKIIQKCGTPWIPRNLCTYFWTLVFCMFFLYPVVLPLMSLGEFLVDKYDNRETKEPGLLRSYLHARKEKVCPLIEYTND